jgi:hypothetical protein
MSHLCTLRRVEMPFIPSLTQIAPRSIHRNNQLNFLNPKPAFNSLLPVDCIAHIIKTFVVNESINPVAFAKYRSVSKLVFPNPSAKVVCNADVKRLAAASQDVNAVAAVVAGLHRSFAPLKMT